MVRARSPNIAPDGAWIWAGYTNMSGPTPNASYTDHSDTSFVFKDEVHAKLWREALMTPGTGELWLHGFFQWDWRDTFIKVDTITPLAGEWAGSFNVTRASDTPPGLDSQFTKGSRFYACAALELLCVFHVVCSQHDSTLARDCYATYMHMHCMPNY